VSEPLSQLTFGLGDRYRVERKLGQGGMATVYLAHDLKHERKVAIKVLKPELAALLGAERFLTEIKTTASLQHPHILPLFDSGAIDPRPSSGDPRLLYYVMPFIDGETLRARLDRETQLGIDEAVRITCDVAEALDAAHRNGIIHRDIKPENILLQGGRPMVADFGIALAVSAAAGGRMTETGMSLGTPQYMSPEQATAEKEISARSDVYSLGCVLYEMLTGHPPHTGASAQQIIMQVVTAEAAPVSKLRKSVPPHVTAAVAKSLEKLPADRFESAQAFADALRNPAFRTTTPTGSGADRWKTGLAAGILLGALAGAAALRLFGPGVEPGGQETREQLTFNGRSEKPAISPAGDFVAFVETTCEPSQVGNCRSALMVQEVGSTQTRVLLRDARSLRAPRWSSDGKAVVVAGELDEDRQGLFAIALLTGTPQLIGPLGAYDTHPAGDSVLLVAPRADRKGMALVIVLGTGAVVDSFRMPFAPGDISWSPDGRHVAAISGDNLNIVTRDGRITTAVKHKGRAPIRWNVEGTGLLTFAFGKGHEDELVRIPVDDDGKVAGPAELVMARVSTLFQGRFDIARRTGLLVLGTGDARTEIWSFDLASRPVRGRRETKGNTWYGYPALSLDSKSIFYLRGDALGDNLYVLDRSTGTEEALTSLHSPAGPAVRMSADGLRVAYNSMGGPVIVAWPSRRVLSGFANINLNRIVPLVPEGFLFQPGASSLATLDSLGGTITALPVADSLFFASFAASPDSRRAIFAAVPRRRIRGGGNTLLQAQVDSVLLGIASLPAGDVRILRVLDADEAGPGLSWDRDGTIYVGRWLSSDESPSVWRLSAETGELTRLADLPGRCNASSISVGGLGRWAICQTEDVRSDIWLIDALHPAKPPAWYALEPQDAP